MTNSGKELTFFEHLDELRKKILVSAAAVSITTVAGYVYSDTLLRIVLRPIRSEGISVYFFSPAEAFLVKLKVAFIVGLFLASPVILNQLWVFISPAFYKHEKKIVSWITCAASFLFLCGILFGFYAAIPVALKFLIGMQTEFLKPMISVTHYVDFVFGLLLAFGVAFNLPLFVIALGSLGVLNTRVLNHYQRHAIVLIFIIAAVLTPSPDVASQVLLAVPLIILFELSVLGVFLVERGKKAVPTPYGTHAR